MKGITMTEEKKKAAKDNQSDFDCGGMRYSIFLSVYYD